MKCEKCGALLAEGVLFCRECGAKVIKKKKFCRECGAKLEEEVKFCSNCGAKVELETVHTQAEKQDDEQICGGGQPQGADATVITEEDYERACEEVSEDENLDEMQSDEITEAESESVWEYGKLPEDKENSTEEPEIDSSHAWDELLKHTKKSKTFDKGPSIIDKDVVKNLKKLKYSMLAISVLIIALGVMRLCLGDGFSFHIARSIEIPVGEEDCIGEKYSDIKTILSESGFTNISQEVIEDLSPSESDKVGQIDDITIDGKTNFEKNDTFKSNAKIVIESHGYKKCTVNIHVNFVSNFLLNRDDVEVFFDDTSQGTLEHGENGDFEIEVDPGEHRVEFVSKDSSSVKGKITLNVDGDVNVSYKIHVYSDEIPIDVEYTENLGEVGENEIMMPASMSEYTDKNYKTVKKDFKKLGFKKIKTEIVYDISFGITEEGSTESVSIDGVKAFERGDIFSNTDQVIITYHMKEEDDPEKIAEKKAKAKAEAEAKKKAEEEAQQKAEEEAKQKAEEEAAKIAEEIAEDATTETVEANLTVDNCSELSAMLSNKADMDSSYANFATKYQGKMIEFDGSTDYCTSHEGQKTRFDYLLSAGDFNPEHVTGPSFKFDNVSYYDLNTDMDSVGVGLNVHIIATVESYDSNTGLFYLKPVSVTKR